MQVRTARTVLSRPGIWLTASLGVLVIVLVWWLAPWHGANPIVLQGFAWANGDVTGIGFDADSTWQARRWGLSPDGAGFVIAGVYWTDEAGTSHLDDSRPNCLSPGQRARVELSFVRIRHWGDSGGPTNVVTGLRCLE